MPKPQCKVAKPFGPKTELSLISNTFPTQPIHDESTNPMTSKYSFDQEADSMDFGFDMEEYDIGVSSVNFSVINKINSLKRNNFSQIGGVSNGIKSIQGIKIRTMEK